MYQALTHDVWVGVEVLFLEEQSQPQDYQYIWAYRVRIENKRDAPVRLMGRYWQVTDALGQVQEVFGEGVVGKTPLIQPHEIFEYTSGNTLCTPSGVMVGQYLMKNEEGDEFLVNIPAFSLDSPYEQVTLN